MEVIRSVTFRYNFF